MPYFSIRSKEILSTCHPDLQDICNTAIQIIDFSVIWGLRDKEQQNDLYNKGLSKLMWPYSKHNIANPEFEKYSKAVDIAPWPIDWTNKLRFILLAGIIKAIAFINIILSKPEVFGNEKTVLFRYIVIIDNLWKRMGE